MIKIIGAGFAGCEASYYLANKGYKIKLYEMRPKKYTEAHKTDKYCELVCSNSFRSDSLLNGVGLLKEELRLLNSLVMKVSNNHKVEAGSSLAVNRDTFSKEITDIINNHPNIEVIHDEVIKFNLDDLIIVATGPLTSDNLIPFIKNITNDDGLNFYDASAPIVSYDSLNLNKIYLKNRYDKGESSYLNCPMNKDEYLNFYNELIKGEVVILKDFEKNVFEGCMPIEVMAKRGENTLLFGPLKPVGLEYNNINPYAVVQLRKENNEGSMYNLVGFQTNLKFQEQKRIFRLIPGLQNAEFLRYGVMHRNTYLNSPKILNNKYQLKNKNNIFFAGQITGVEGYIESASSGLLSGIYMDKYLKNDNSLLPSETMIQSLANYVSFYNGKDFQPMNANFGIMKDLDKRYPKKEKKQMYSKRSLDKLKEYLNNGY